MNLTIKDIPSKLHSRLREEAEAHGRSLNKQILQTLENAVMPHRISEEDLLEKIRRHRISLNVLQTEKMVNEAKNYGRE